MATERTQCSPLLLTSTSRPPARIAPFHWIGPVLGGLLPWRWRRSRARVLKPWARVVITLWVLAVVPMLAFALFTMVVTLPRIVGTAWAACRAQAAMTSYTWHQGDVLAALAHVAFVVWIVAARHLWRLWSRRSRAGRTWRDLGPVEALRRIALAQFFVQARFEQLKAIVGERRKAENRPIGK